jgi:circadian clock protein KaiC
LAIRGERPKVSTGIEGLDDVLNGGLPAGRLYLLQGDPGVGKTTMALQFLLDGAAKGERVLYVSLSETRDELESVAHSHGWSLDAVELYELSAIAEALAAESVQTVFRSADVELTEITEKLLSKVEEIQPLRVVFDSLSELRLLARDPLRYRRQILSLKQFFAGRDTTVLLLDDRTSEGSDLQLQSIAHGVIFMEQTPPAYGVDRRQLRILKLRGVRFRSGFHDFTVETGGIEVYPRLVAAEFRRTFEAETASSSLPGLDSLLGGGLDRGVSSLFMGPAGVGKSTLAAQFAVAAAERGEVAALYSFEESSRTLFARSASLGQDVQRHVEEGRIKYLQVDPAERTPGEFSQIVRRHVESDGAKVVVIDSLNGYMNSMPGDRFLVLQLHELLSYLGQKGVASILVVAQHGMMGPSMAAPFDVSYLADTVLLFRYYEHGGHIRQALSVVKRRGGEHERAIRELTISAEKGIHIGAPLEHFRGVLTGVPVFQGSNGQTDERTSSQS